MSDDMDIEIDGSESDNKVKSKKKKQAPITNLDELRSSINSVMGAGTIALGRGTIVNVDTFPTGIATIDKACGCGGIPQGRIIELFGNESSGKTTTCIRLIAACQQHYFEKKKRHGVAAIIDVEQAFDPEWASKCGVNLDTLLFSQPDGGEAAFDILKKIVASGLVDLVVVDSVANMVPIAEMESDIGDQQIGAQARMMSKGLRSITGKANKTKTTVIFINQVRNKIGVAFGSPETTPGGKALRFYSSMRMEIFKGGKLTEGDKVYGFRPKIRFVKNKCAPPFTTAEFDICFGIPPRNVYGLDPVSGLVEVAESEKIITKNGNFYVYGDIKLGNGKANAIEFVRNSPQILNDLRDKIYGKLGKLAADVIVPDNTEIPS